MSSLSPDQSLIPGALPRAASTALVLEGMLLLVVVATGSARSQTLTVLHSFTGKPDGGLPLSSLVRDGSGNLYGTTDIGGAFNYGTVYKVSATGTESVLYSFTGVADGSPEAGLIRANGNLYGTTSEGGTFANGTVFVISKSVKTVLYNFTGKTDGGFPEAGLIRDPAGNLYGTATQGGAMANCNGYGCGVVFK